MERKTSLNTGFASGGVMYPAIAGELCVPYVRDSVLVDNFVLRVENQPS